MHSALFVATIPKEKGDWGAFLQNVVSMTKNVAGIQRLSENVWLLDLTQSIDGLGLLSSYCHRHGFDCGILPFAEAPQWLPAAFDPMPIPARSE